MIRQWKDARGEIDSSLEGSEQVTDAEPNGDGETEYNKKQDFETNDETEGDGEAREDSERSAKEGSTQEFRPTECISSADYILSNDDDTEPCRLAERTAENDM